jgi:thiol:disulfide interchange protein DsbD
LSLPLALLFAILGGLILNFMPCVLPILAMKALAIASHAGKEGREAAREGLAYGAGAILSFAALGGAVIALRASGEALGWGFQLQEPIVVAVFALLMFAVALNLSGVFEVPGIGAGDALARHGGIAGAFFTGVLAVAVAAPCTAPFMAAALGFALTQNDATALSVFLALGLGFAAPFVAIGLSPRLLRLLPKPGAWMTTLRQLLAFPMYATALWLLWVLSVQSGPGQMVVVLAVALALGFGLWALGVAQSSTRWGRAAGWTAFVLSLSSLALLMPLVDSGHQAEALPSPRGIAAEPYSEARLSALRSQHRAVFVNATAAWCITCMVNEKVAFDDDRVRAAFASGHVAYLVADWTKRDSAVTALLDAHGRSGVPLYLYFPPDGTEAKTLPQVLTPDDVLGAINSR